MTPIAAEKAISVVPIFNDYWRLLKIFHRRFFERSVKRSFRMHEVTGWWRWFFANSFSPNSRRPCFFENFYRERHVCTLIDRLEHRHDVRQKSLETDCWKAWRCNVLGKVQDGSKFCEQEIERFKCDYFRSETEDYCTIFVKLWSTPKQILQEKRGNLHSHGWWKVGDRWNRNDHSSL